MRTLLFFGVLLFLVNCSSRKINKSSVENNEISEESEISIKDKVNSVNASEVRSETVELRNIISNLNIDYTGKNPDDKLDVLLKQSGEGTKLTISGIGSAGFRESAQSEVKVLKRELIKHWDSLHFEQIREIKHLKTEIKQEIFTKEVQTRGNNFVLWGLLCLVTAGLVLFKRYLKPILMVFKS